MVLEHSPSLRVRLNDIDYINVAPGALDNSSLNRVPVLRIYGDSSTGQKACVHVHNVYPYFYIEYCGDSVDATTGLSHTHPFRVLHMLMLIATVKRYISKLFHSLNQALTVSLQRKTNNHSAVFIRAIILVKGVHFYGFHASHSPFLKIYLADPSVVSRAAAILQTGTVMSTRFRVFESHISYPLQFMCDFNLYGCGWLELGEVWQREDRSLLFASADKESDAHFKPSPYFRQTHMQLEVDVAAHQILNRHGLSERNIHHELKIPALPPPSESLVASVRELWDDERRRRVSHGLAPSPEIPADPSERSRGKGGDWVQEAEFWDGIRMRLQREGKNAPTLAAAGDWERYVMTTFESIEALWEDIHKVWKPAPREPQAHSAGSSHETTAEVDEPNSFEPMTQLSIIPDIASDHDGIDVDEVMLATQAVKRFIADEQGRDHEADTPHVPLDTNAEEEVGETAADFNDLDGRPVTPHKQASSARASPFKTPSKRPLPTSRPGTPYRPLLPTTLGTPLKAANPFFSAFGHLTAYVTCHYTKLMR
jgi:DNA polymerase zeta